MGKEYNCNIICSIFEYISYDSTITLLNNNFDFDKFETGMGWFKVWGKGLCLDEITEERLIKSLQEDMIFLPALKVQDLIDYIHRETDYRIDYGIITAEDKTKSYIGLIQLKERNGKGEEKEMTLKMVYGNGYKSPQEALKSTLEDFLSSRIKFITNITES